MGSKTKHGHQTSQSHTNYHLYQTQRLAILFTVHQIESAYGVLARHTIEGNQ